MEEKLQEIIKLAQEVRHDCNNEEITDYLYDIVEKAQYVRYMLKKEE